MKAEEKAISNGYKYFATSGSYPITEGTEINVAKLNKALKAHWEEMGLA